MGRQQVVLLLMSLARPTKTTLGHRSIRCLGNGGSFGTLERAAEAPSINQMFNRTTIHFPTKTKMAEQYITIDYRQTPRKYRSSKKKKKKEKKETKRTEKTGWLWV